MKRRFRLKKTTEFKRVRRFGKSYTHPLVVLILRPNQKDASLFGIAAGRSVGNAVRRNRAKRRLRAALHNLIELVPPGWDVVLIARRPLVNASFTAIQAAIHTLLQQAKLLNRSNDE